MFVFPFHLTAFFQSEFFLSYLSSGIYSKDAMKAIVMGHCTGESKTGVSIYGKFGGIDDRFFQLLFHKCFKNLIPVNIQKAHCVVGW